ncbi:MAG: fasciclin domain-containing protein [Planctomycetota bacterium]
MESKRLRRPRPLLRVALAASALVLATACNDDDDSGGSSGGPQTSTTIGGRLDALGLTTLRATLDSTGLLPLLDGPGPYTLFAPTNAAFAALDPAELNALFDPANASALEYHIADGDFDAAALQGQRAITMRTGADSLVDPIGPLLLVNEARVVERDVLASNGMIHIIDVVLREPTSVVDTLDARGLTTLASLVTQAGLEPALTGANVTLFAPTNDAFDALPPGVLADLQDPLNGDELRELLSYHVRSEGRIVSELFEDAETPSLIGALQYYGLRGLVPKVNNIPLASANVPATDGVVHTVESVLGIPNDVLGTLEDRGFTTFVTALEAAELDDDLATGGPFTIFAPTDAAFAQLPPGVLQSLLDPQNQQQLIDLIRYHVLPEVQQARELRQRRFATTLLGMSLAIDPLGGVLTLDETTDVVRPDYFGANGSIHAIPDVLSPTAP